MVACRENKHMTMAGSGDPCALVRLNSIGAVGKDVNNKHTQAISGHITKMLNVEAGR